MPLSEDTLFFGYKEKMTEEQNIYVDSIIDNKVTVVNACAGTGKTTLAVAAARYLQMPLIYIFAPVQEKEMGYRKGTQTEKEREYTAPLVGALLDLGESPLHSIYDPDMALDPRYKKEIEQREKSGDIWCYPRSHTFARGINIEHQFVVIDEAQNFTRSELRKVITRMHDDCKLVLIGHVGQCDLADPHTSGFKDYIELYKTRDYAKVCNLTQNFRGEISRDADKIDEFMAQINRNR